MEIKTEDQLKSAAEYEMTEFTLHTQEDMNTLRVCQAARAQNDVRHYLNGMLFERQESGGYRLVATNGNILAYADLTEPDGSIDYIKNNRILDIQGTIPATTASAVFTLRPQAVEKVRLEGAVELYNSKGKLQKILKITEVEGTFPDYRKEMVARDHSTPCWGNKLGLNIEYAHRLAKACDGTRTLKSVIALHAPASKDGAIPVTLMHAEHIQVVIMPVRVD